MFLNKLRLLPGKVASLRQMLRENKESSIKSLLLLGRLHAERVKELPPAADLSRCEFKVFSQNGEDGIIQFLISNVEIEHKTFIEFGVENYKEANTRFLLQNDNWQGLVIDGSPDNIASIKADDIFWRFDLQATNAFITKENINTLLASSGFDPDVGVLSIDIDGNDYWVWDAISVIKPRIVIIEYNALFGLSPVSIPYKADFTRTSAHYSNLYYGASLSAMQHLGTKKGYKLIGTDSIGINAFFAREDVAKSLPKSNLASAYRPSFIRDSRDKNGNLTFVRANEKRTLIEELSVVNVITNELIPLREAFMHEMDTL